MTVHSGVAVASFPGGNGRIAYQSYSGVGDVPYAFHSSRPDGTGQRRLVRGATSLNFSADGRRIVFTRATPYLDPQVGAGVLLAGANGRDRSWLLRGGFQPATGTSWEGMQWAAFSPDGSQVVFVVAERTPLPPDGYRLGPNVHVVAVDGTNPRLLAYGADRPVFSPDGTRIAYLVHGAMGTEGTAVETVDADGTDRRTLVAPHRYITRVDFAPDGKRLVAVESGRGIVIVNAQTGERTRLHRRVLGPVADAVWSPDGRRIAYAVYDRHSESDLATKPHVYVIRPDGTGKRLAFTARVPDIGMLAWQPLP